MNSKHPWLKVTEVYLLSSWQYKVGVLALQVPLLHTDLGGPAAFCSVILSSASIHIQMGEGDAGKRHTYFLKALARE